ncbi:MAG: TIR domain-containing protein [candidate division NC10 bacterium]|nr:TIR domain-containing protein [candidate division NC10 bacterium]
MSDIEIVRNKHVFLSYSSADSALAHRIAARIQAARLPIWLDEWELAAADPIAKRLDRGSTSSSVLLLLFSYAASLSLWVRRELAAGLRDDFRARAISPLLVRLDNSKIPEALMDLKYVDLHSDFDAGLAVLLQSIRDASAIDLGRLDPRMFELLIADLLRSEGYDIQRISRGQELGFDLVAMASPEKRSVLPERLLVECKHRRSERAGVAALHEVVASLARVAPQAACLLAVSGQLTSVARAYLSEQVRKFGVNLRVMEGAEVMQSLLQKPALVQRYFAAGEIE